MNPLISTALVIIGIITIAVAPPIGIALLIWAIVGRVRFNRRVKFYRSVYTAKRFEAEEDAYINACRRLP